MLVVHRPRGRVGRRRGGDGLMADSGTTRRPVHLSEIYPRDYVDGWSHADAEGFEEVMD